MTRARGWALSLGVLAVLGTACVVGAVDELVTADAVAWRAP